YAEMINRAKTQVFAYPAINCTSSQTINAAIRGVAEAGSDGIVQLSTGGAEYISGTTIMDRVRGAIAVSVSTAGAATSYERNAALHPGHAPKQAVEEWVKPLLAASTERVKNGGEPYFQSHMWDGSAVPLDENLVLAEELLELS